MKYSRHTAPEVTEETADLVTLQDRWDEEFHLYPTDGIIQDYMYHTLGWETSNLYAFWSAIAGLSSLAGRAVNLRAGMQLFPNFYIILVGPPGLAKKSTGMNLWEDVEDNMWPYLPEHLSETKKSPVIRSKATPEFLFTQMQNRDLEHSPGEMSDAILKIRVSELDNFMSKATYNATLIGKLTDFYDCRKYDTDGVLGRNNGKLAEIRNIYATLFGCTTPTALQNSLPEEAFGGGFMSRATIVTQEVEDLHRECSFPFFPSDAPDSRDMGERLAWVVTNKNGEYTMTPEAFRFYDRWYSQVMKEIKEKALKGDADHRDNRITVQVLKLATLFAYQRYSLERRVTLKDLVLAINIIDYTMKKSTNVLDKVQSVLSIDAKLLRFYRILKKYGDKGVNRKILGRAHNYKVREIDEYAQEIIARGLGTMRRVPTLEGPVKNEIRYFILDDTKGEEAFVQSEKERKEKETRRSRPHV